MTLVDADTVKIAPQPKHKYGNLVDELKQLVPGKAVVFRIPQGLAYLKMYQRSATLIDYYGLKAPTDYLFSRALSADKKHMVFTLKPKRDRAGDKTTKRAMKKLKKIKKLVLKVRTKVIKAEARTKVKSKTTAKVAGKKRSHHKAKAKVAAPVVGDNTPVADPVE